MNFGTSKYECKWIVATAFFCSLLTTTPALATCLWTHVIDESGHAPPRDEYYCFAEASSFLFKTPQNPGSEHYVQLGPGTSTQDQLHGPTPLTPAKIANIKCGADKYGTQYPKVPGYTETFVSGFGYEDINGFSYVIPKQNPIDPFTDADLDGDTRFPDSLIYYYGWHAGYAYEHTFLDSWEYSIYTLVHERAHQHGVHDDAPAGLNNQIGLAAALAYRADNHAKCPR